MATNITRTQTKTSDGGGSATSVKTTTYETTRSSFQDEPAYRPKLTQRSLVIQRGGSMPHGSMSMQKSMQYAPMNVGHGAYQAVSAVGITNVKSSRDREKKDMQDLNERFASYIERVRFLEAQNRKLADELDKLKAKWGKETTAIKAMYQAELDEARRLLDDAEKEKARLQIRATTIEQDLEELREKWVPLSLRIVSIDNLLRWRYDSGPVRRRQMFLLNVIITAGMLMWARKHSFIMFWNTLSHDR